MSFSSFQTQFYELNKFMDKIIHEVEFKKAHVIHGTKDEILSFYLSKKFVNLTNSNAKIYLLTNETHLLNQDRPKIFSLIEKIIHP